MARMKIIGGRTVLAETVSQDTIDNMNEAYKKAGALENDVRELKDADVSAMIKKVGADKFKAMLKPENNSVLRKFIDTSNYDKAFLKLAKKYKDASDSKSVSTKPENTLEDLEYIRKLGLNVTTSNNAKLGEMARGEGTMTILGQSTSVTLDYYVKYRMTILRLDDLDTENESVQTLQSIIALTEYSPIHLDDDGTIYFRSQKGVPVEHFIKCINAFGTFADGAEKASRDFYKKANKYMNFVVVDR